MAMRDLLDVLRKAEPPHRGTALSGAGGEGALCVRAS